MQKLYSSQAPPGGMPEGMPGGMPGTTEPTIDEVD